MKTKQRVQIESPTSEIHRVVVESGEERELCTIRINNARKRRLKVIKHQRKHACMHAHDKIFKNSTLENHVGLSYGLVSVVGKRKEMEDAVRAELGFVGLPDSSSKSLVLTEQARDTHSISWKDNDKFHMGNTAYNTSKRLVLADRARATDGVLWNNNDKFHIGNTSMEEVFGNSSSRRLVLIDRRDALVTPERDHEKFDFFAVYDGHGGAGVAEACRERMHELLASAVVAEEGGGCDFWERVMEESFVKMDELVMGDERFCGGGNDEKASAMRTTGSTAVVAVVGKDVVVVANCGDSRAVMSKDGVAVALSNDHKPNRPDELQRIEAAGGRVINWNGHRVLGVLATSRSIGDQFLKPYVIPKPEVTVTDRANTDEFLILASDGLWDLVSNDVACQVVRGYLNNHRKKNTQDFVKRSWTAKAAAALAKLAMSRGSTDNISVIVVDLRQVQPS